LEQKISGKAGTIVVGGAFVLFLFEDVFFDERQGDVCFTGCLDDLRQEFDLLRSTTQVRRPTWS
jgi:hypothetical protein